jgi:PST family polysaccharide transporter
MSLEESLVNEPTHDDASAIEGPSRGQEGDPGSGPLARVFLSGTLLTAAGRYSNYLVQLAATAVLARLLTPAAFGIIAMVTVYTGFVTILADSGMNAAVIQRRNLTHRQLSTAFWFSFGIGIFLTVLTILVAPLVERLFKFPGLTSVLRVMSLSLLLVSLTAVPKGMLSRDLHFGRLARIEVTSAAVSGALAIGAAFAGAGYWSLVLQQLVMLAIRLVLVVRAAKWLPEIVFDTAVLATVLSFSGYVLGFSLVNYWARNADNLLIGRVQGAQQLGYYSQAYRLMVVPQLLLTGILQTVIHPVFSNLQHDRERARLAYFRILELLIPISALLATYIFFMSPEIIHALLGPNWEPSVPVLRWLSIAAAVQPVAALTGPVLMARDRANWFFRLGVLSTLVFVAGFLLTVSIGIVAVAVGYAVTNFIVAPAVIYVSYGRAYGGRLTDLARPVLVAVGLCAILGMVLFWGHSFLSGIPSVAALIAAAVPLGILLLLGSARNGRRWLRGDSGW